MQKLPITTQLDKVEIKKVYGQSIFDYHQQIRKLIASKKELRHLIDFFAEPSVNGAKQQILWYTHLHGEVTALTDMAPIERIEISKNIELIYTEIRKLSEELARSQGSSSLGAEALRSMLITPDISVSLFKINNKLVLSEWGCIPFGSTPENYDLFVQDNNYKNKFRTKTQDPLSSALISADLLSDPIAEEITHDNSTKNNLPMTEEQILEDPEETVSDITESNEQEIENKEPLPDEPETSQFDWFCIFKLLSLLILFILFVYLLLSKPWFITDQNYRNMNEQLKSEIANLWNQVDQRAKNCDKQNIIPEDKPLKNEEIEEMKFPTRKKDLSELKGCWTTLQTLVEQHTLKPLEYHYCFRNNNGNGYVTIDLSNGDHCEASLKTTRKNNSLTMKYDPIICENTLFSAGRIECHAENELAVCDIIDIHNGVDEPIDTQIKGAHFNRVDGE